MTPKNPHYPLARSLELIDSYFTTPVTRAALEERLQPASDLPRFLPDDLSAVLAAICDRVLPQPEREQPIPVAPQIEQRLATGQTDGWRYDALPADGDAYLIAMRGLDDAARSRHGSGFAAVAPEAQDALLSDFQAGRLTSGALAGFACDKFFGGLLAEAVENYYSHPLGYAEIGYAGFADAPRWNRIGLNEREAREIAAATPEQTGSETR